MIFVYGFLPYLLNITHICGFGNTIVEKFFAFPMSFRLFRGRKGAEKLENLPIYGIFKDNNNFNNLY